MKNRKWLNLVVAGSMMLGMSTAAMANEGEVGVGEGPTVTLWICQWGGENFEATVRALAEKGTQANIGGMGIVLEPTIISWDNYYDTYLTAVASGTAPDIAAEASTGPVLYADMGEALDLTPLYDQWVEEGSPIVSEVPQEAFDYFTYNDQLIGIPFAVDCTGVVYNTEMFEEAGIKELPTTWNEFAAVCDKLLETFPDKIPVAIACNAPQPCTAVLDWMLHSNAAATLTADMQGGLLEDNAIEVLEIFKDFYEKGYFGEAAVSYSDSDAQRLFMAGEAAMIRTSAPGWLSGNEMHDKAGALAPTAGPSVEEGKSLAAYQAYHAFDQSGHPEATIAALKWWIENIEVLFTEGGDTNIPVQTSLQEKVIQDPLMKDFIEKELGQSESYVWPNTAMLPVHSVLDSEGTAAAAIQMILTGDDVVTAAESANAAINEVLEDLSE